MPRKNRENMTVHAAALTIAAFPSSPVIVSINSRHHSNANTPWNQRPNRRIFTVRAGSGYWLRHLNGLMNVGYPPIVVSHRLPIPARVSQLDCRPGGEAEGVARVVTSRHVMQLAFAGLITLTFPSSRP